MEINEQLETIRELLTGEGREKQAMSVMMDVMADMAERLGALEAEFETLLDAIGANGDSFPFSEECDSYVVTCPGCGCKLEIGSDLMEDEEAQLECPDCGAVLTFA